MTAAARPADAHRAAPAGLVIAVDGTSGSGKSSTCRGVAARLGLAYLDTGAMFRAVTWALLEHGVDVHDADAVAARVADPALAPVSGTDPTAPTIHVDGVDVAEAIRTQRVTDSVSPVSTVPAVRALLLAQQRAIIADAVRDGGAGIVVEGRDIGTVVAPDAPVKVYLTADPAARAARRAAEQGAQDDAALAATRASLLDRDRIDSGRATAPLTMAADAVHLDTTPLSLEEVIGRVVALAEAVEAHA